MATSLASQLKKLRTPQTNLLLQDKKRPSLLFDPKEAANLDRDTVLSIGLSGLEELQKLSTVFGEFQTTLFAQSSVNFERAVQDATVNKKLDAEIAKFLLFATPYFLLNACHKALEWLVFRYYIHQYNREQFILMILPYHETRMFVRALQLVDLSDESDKWHWLTSVQKRGLILPSGILIKHLISDKGLLKTLCTHVIFATKTYFDQASCLTTLYAFYTTAVLGVIELGSITEVHVNYLLPTLLHGLKSPILDFAASSYMIIAKLITKVKLNDDTMEKLLLMTFKKTHLKQEAVTFLLYLYQSPINRLIVVPPSLVLQLSELPWFIETVAKVNSSDINVSRFIVPFLQAACQLIVERPEDTSSVQNMIGNMLGHIRLDNDVVDAILSGILTCEFFKDETSKSAKDFLARFYQNFERSYPENFDRYLKKLMKQGESDEKSKQALHFLTSWPFGTKSTQESVEILDKLMHISAVQRVVALEILAKNDINVPESFRGIMTSSLQARFYDNDVNVVKTLLSFPIKRLTSLLPTDTLVDELLVLLSMCHTASRKVLAKPALKILLELCEESDDTSVFITALPYLFPTTDDDVEVAMEVLRSNFAKNNMYMQRVIEDISKSKLNAEAVSSAAFHNILNYELLPPTESILNSMRQQISHSDAASLFFNMILLGSVCRVPVGSMPVKTARDVIEMATEMIKTYPRVKLLRDCNNITGHNIQMALKLTSEGILPLQVGTYVLEMVHRRLNIKFESKLDFDNNAERSNLILRLLEMFIEGMDNRHWRKHYSRCLQIFFQLHFATVKDLVCFLAQFYIKPVKTQTSYHCLQISLLLLNQCKSVQWAFQDQDFVTNLLLSLTRRNNECRRVAVDILKKLTQTFSLTAEPFFVLLQKLATENGEICNDPDHLALSFYFLLSPDPHVSHQIKEHKKLQQAQKLIFNAVTQQNEAPKIPLDRRSQLLDILVNVNSTEILRQLAPMGLQLLPKLTEDPKNRSAGNALRNILERLTINTVDALKDEQVWSLFKTCILVHEPCAVLDSGDQTSPSIIVLKRISAIFDMLSHDLQVSILSKVLDVMIDCEMVDVVSVAGKTIRGMCMDATILISELEAMKLSGQVQEESADSEMTASARKRKKRQSQIQLAHPAMVHSRAWKRGVVLLEFAERADTIKREELLYSILFDLLNVCLSLEEQGPVEYTNQLLLSTIFRMMKKKLPVRDAGLQITLIVKCIRTSRNPQTHYHALQVLVEFLKNLDVQRALFNLMPIFTFMGSTMVRQDDAYSIQIISKTLETVVPIINAADDATQACELLRTFIVSLPHIPEHRRMPLFVKLLQLLDNHLHLYYLLTFESHVMKIASQKTDHSTQWLDFALQVSQEFPPYRLLEICTKVIKFIKILPIDIEEEQGRKEAMKFQYKYIYNVTKSTPKSFRHYKITAVQFLSNLLLSEDFINRVAVLSQDEIDNMNQYCDHLAIELILLIQTTSKTADQHQNKSSAKYWKVLLHHLYDVLDLVNNLLPNTLFLQSIKNLLKHELLPVKKKALELLNTRLLQKKFGEDVHADLLSLIEPLADFLEGKIENQEQEVVQQTVLISLKLLAKLLATSRPAVFKPILDTTTELLQSKNGPVLASAALCVAELCSSMRTHALYSLNKFVPAILNLLKTHCHQNVPDIIVISIVSALQKIVESLGNFLSLYLDQLLSELTMLSSQYTNTEHPKACIVLSRLKATTEKLSSCIPLRVLLPAVNETYDMLLNNKSYKCIPSLMSVLAESFDSVQSTELKVEVDNLANFFLEVLRFRERIEDNMKTDDDAQITLKDIVAVEESASKALVSLLLKLSEVTFRPLYDKLYGWAANETQYKQRNITFYRISANIAECLKSLFVLFAGLFLKHAASLLSSNNIFVTDTPQELTLPDESSRIELTEAILLTLHRVFGYDVHNFVSQDRFEILMQPIVDQVENTMGTREEYESRANQLIVPCIASFASAISDDSLHKQLVYQTLLKTRHVKPYVRSTALNALVEIARKLGEDFMPLLPETVPFLAEMLEDEDEATEKCAQNAVRTLEEILGEPLQKYF